MRPGLRAILFGRRAVLTNSAAYQQFVDRLATPPTAARAALYATFIDTLVAAGVWAKADALKLCAAADQATALTNLKSASFASIKAGAVANPTFTVDRGWNGTGANYLNPQFNPSTAGGNWVQNSAAIAAWSLTAAQSSQNMVGSVTGPAFASYLFPRYTNDTALYVVNASTGDDNVANTNGSGFFVASRTASNLTTLYRNGASIATTTRASQALGDDNIHYGPTASPCALVYLGAGLSPGEVTAFYNAASAYLTAVGAI